MEKQFQVALPDELLTELGWRDSEVPGRMRESLVMELLRMDRLSEARAAELLGLDRWELLETMGRHQVSAIRMSAEELKEEIAKGVRRNAQ